MLSKPKTMCYNNPFKNLIDKIQGGEMATLEEFKKLELIVAQIKEVSDHPDADRLYIVKVDTGKEEKQLVAGIKKSYTKEQLIGRRVIMINNLEPAMSCSLV